MTISLRWQWYLSGRSTSVHWSKIAVDLRPSRKIRSPHITQASSWVTGGRCCWCDMLQPLLLLPPRCLVIRVTGSVQCDILNIFTARRYSLALCPSVCLSQVAAQPITVLCKATCVYMPILGGVVWPFYHLLRKNGWTDRRQSLKPTPMYAKCNFLVERGN